MGDSSKPKKEPMGKRRGRPALASAKERAKGKVKLLTALDRLGLTSFLSYREFLQKIYDEVKQVDHSYSYGQLSEDLGFSRSNVMWLVISGRRKLSRKACERITQALGLTGRERRYFETLVNYNNTRRSDEREQFMRELIEIKSLTSENVSDQNVLEYFSEWYHPVIRELVGLPDFQSDYFWINDRLVTKLLPMQILKSLELLERLSLIAYDRKLGRHVQTGGQIKPDRSVERMASVRFHQKMCDMARDSVTKVPADRRELNTLTLRVSDEVAMKAGEILYKACEQIMKLESESKSGDQIYQINVHLFPFTALRSNK